MLVLVEPILNADWIAPVGSAVETKLPSHVWIGPRERTRFSQIAEVFSRPI